ncbi:MAG: alpha/beta hydrolase, partial [Victivallales bacterium]|nr:alpha/beta hydrolase [Victivallales bacterium]
NFQTYPNVTAVSGFAENYDTTKDFFIFLHGFNVDLQEAYKWNRVMFRRLHWSGYRDNYIGLTWEGDEGNFTYFDTNVFHALQSSRSVRQFLTSLPTNKNISIGAHSLGNLVMWDALRLHKALGGGTLVENAISIQGAVWEEAFWEQDNVEYTATTDPGHAITYTEDQLKRHSWAFYFRQTGHVASDAVAGETINSHTYWDYALMLQKTTNVTAGTAYNRDNTQPYRTPQPNAGSNANWALPEYSALMQVGRRTTSYSNSDITNPIGLTIVPFFGRTVQAHTLGWGTVAHSDCKDIPLYVIYPWVFKVFDEFSSIIH